MKTRHAKYTTATLIGATLLLQMSVSCYASSIGSWNYEWSILFPDLVVRGVVREIGEETVPWDNYMPKAVETNDFPITVLNVQILEVLKGTWDGQYLTVVVPGGYAGKPGGLTTHSYNYEIGDEMILPLTFLGQMKGGSYTVTGDQGRFRQDGEVWVNQARAEMKMTVDEIRQIARKASLESMVKEADVVGCGTIEEVKPHQSGPVRGLELVTMRTEELWKGTSGSDRVAFRVVRKNGFDLSWYAPAPEMHVGEKWLFFLKRDDDGFYPFAGTNGLLRVEGDYLIVANRLKHGLSRTRFVERVKQEVGR